MQRNSLQNLHALGATSRSFSICDKIRPYDVIDSLQSASIMEMAAALFANAFNAQNRGVVKPT